MYSTYRWQTANYSKPGALSIQQKFRFEISETSRAQYMARYIPVAQTTGRPPSVSCGPLLIEISLRKLRFFSLFAAGDVSRAGTSVTQRQKFHTDDVKSVRNPVRSADWSTE